MSGMFVEYVVGAMTTFIVFVVMVDNHNLTKRLRRLEKRLGEMPTPQERTWLEQFVPENMRPIPASPTKGETGER